MEMTAARQAWTTIYSKAYIQCAVEWTNAALKTTVLASESSCHANETVVELEYDTSYTEEQCEIDGKIIPRWRLIMNKLLSEVVHIGPCRAQWHGCGGRPFCHVEQNRIIMPELYMGDTGNQQCTLLAVYSWDSEVPVDANHLIRPYAYGL